MFNAAKLLRPTARAFSTSASRADLARLSLIGRVGATPEHHTSSAGNEYIKYSLVVNHTKEKSSWFNVTVFDDQLKDFVGKYVDKGSLLYIEADASMNKYVAQDGSNRYSLSLIQQSINPITWPKRTDETTESAQE